MRLIDADALIKKCGDWYTEEGPEEGFIGTIEMLVNEQPDIEPKQEWVPCSERLPSENGRAYLTYQCCEDTRRGWCQVLDYYDGWNCTKQDRESEIKGVVAWMPLPEPWRGADDE